MDLLLQYRYPRCLLGKIPGQVSTWAIYIGIHNICTTAATWMYDLKKIGDEAETHKTKKKDGERKLTITKIRRAECKKKKTILGETSYKNRMIHNSNRHSKLIDRKIEYYLPLYYITFK